MYQTVNDSGGDEQKEAPGADLSMIKLVVEQDWVATRLNMTGLLSAYSYAPIVYRAYQSNLPHQLSLVVPFSSFSVFGFL